MIRNEKNNNKAKDKIVRKKELEGYHCHGTGRQNEEYIRIFNSDLACVSLSKE